MTLAIFIQLMVFGTGAIAIYLTQQSNPEWQRYAPIVGLIGEPFWFYDSYTNQSWGILGLTTAYTVIWCIGLKNHWFTNKEKPCLAS